MLEEVERWLAARSWSADERPLDTLLAAKRAAGAGTVSVVLPARDEEGPSARSSPRSAGT